MPVLSYITPELESHVFYPVIKQMGHKVIYDLAIENIASGQMHIPHENLTFRNTHGYWGAEQQMFTQKVSYVCLK